MRVEVPHEWPDTAEAARRIQDELAPLVEIGGSGPDSVSTIAGLDVSYDGDRLAAAVVVLDTVSLEVVASSTARGTAAFPYISGLFAFRELPTLIEALRGLDMTPDLLVCDGYGVAHPRRFGLACHLGVLTGLPSIGVGKTAFVGRAGEPGIERGAGSDLVDAGEVVGRALRTQRGVKPVYVSAGHRIGLDAACRHVLAAAPRYRLPETTRRADRLSRDLLGRT